MRLNLFSDRSRLQGLRWPLALAIGSLGLAYGIFELAKQLELLEFDALLLASHLENDPTGQRAISWRLWEYAQIRLVSGLRELGKSSAIQGLWMVSSLGAAFSLVSISMLARIAGARRWWFVASLGLAASFVFWFASLGGDNDCLPLALLLSSVYLQARLTQRPDGGAALASASGALLGLSIAFHWTHAVALPLLLLPGLRPKRRRWALALWGFAICSLVLVGFAAAQIQEASFTDFVARFEQRRSEGSWGPSAWWEADQNKTTPISTQWWLEAGGGLVSSLIPLPPSPSEAHDWLPRGSAPGHSSLLGLLGLLLLTSAVLMSLSLARSLGWIGVVLFSPFWLRIPFTLLFQPWNPERWLPLLPFGFVMLPLWLEKSASSPHMRPLCRALTAVILSLLVAGAAWGIHYSATSPKPSAVASLVRERTAGPALLVRGHQSVFDLHVSHLLPPTVLSIPTTPGCEATIDSALARGITVLATSTAQRDLRARYKSRRLFSSKGIEVYLIEDRSAAAQERRRNDSHR